MNSGFLRAAGDLMVKLVLGLAEFTEALAQPTGKFRQLLGSEQQEKQKEDQDHFLISKAENGERESVCHTDAGSIGSSERYGSAWPCAKESCDRRRHRHHGLFPQ